jgi:hypothetical protein
MRTENFMKLTMTDIEEIRGIEKVAKNIGEWKSFLKDKATKFGITDREAIDICNGRL